eukprot:5618283-Pleurochrysis_carterae.AAC.1
MREISSGGTSALHNRPCERARARLRVGSGGVGDEGGWLLAVGAQAGDDLGRVRVEVVRHVGQRDLGRVEVLEGDVHTLERRLENVLSRVEHARLIRVEGKALAREELVLQARGRGVVSFRRAAMLLRGYEGRDGVEGCERNGWAQG